MPESARTHVEVRLEERIEGRIANVTIDHGVKLNSFTSALMEELASSLEKLSTDDSLRAVVLTGAGERAFSGGANLEELAALNGTTAEAFITLVHRCCSAVRDLPVPVIARLHGFVLGAGLELAASCDLRIAADNAIFGMPEVKLGIPSVVEAALLPGLVGWGRARLIMLLGENFAATDAERWGLVEKVVPASELDTELERWIASLLAAGPRAVRLQKELMRQWENLPLRDAISAGIPALSAAWGTDEPVRMMRDVLAARARRR
jgi:enoyl-CoA hydratase/carnithine racemase